MIEVKPGEIEARLSSGWVDLERSLIGETRLLRVPAGCQGNAQSVQSAYLVGMRRKVALVQHDRLFVIAAAFFRRSKIVERQWILGVF